MANLLLQAGGIFSENTSTLTLTEVVNPGDLIIVQIAQKEGSLGTVSDGLNLYYIYSSNTNPLAPQSYNFYTIAASRLEIGQTITYTANGLPTTIGSALYIFRKDQGERFGQPIAFTATTGATPRTSITTTIPGAIGPAILIGTTSLQSMSGYNFPSDYNGGANWTGTYLDAFSGLGASFKISRSTATQTYTSSFSTTTAFQTLLNFPILLDVGQASTTSNGYVGLVRLISAIQAGAKAGGNINLNPVSQAMTSRGIAKISADVRVSVDIQPQPTLNVRGQGHIDSTPFSYTRTNLAAKETSFATYPFSGGSSLTSTFVDFITTPEGPAFLGSPIGGQFLKLTSPGSSATIQSGNTFDGLAPTTPYTFSAYVYSPVDTSFQPTLYWYSPSSTYLGGFVGSNQSVKANTWTRVFVTATSVSNTVKATWYLQYNGPSTSAIYFAGFMVEQTTLLLPYFGKNDIDLPAAGNVTRTEILGTFGSRITISKYPTVYYNPSAIAGATTNARIRLNALVTPISPIRANADSGASIFEFSTQRISPIRGIARSRAYVDPLISSILTYDLSLSASGKPALRDRFSLVISMPTDTAVGNNAASNTNANSRLSVNYRIPMRVKSTSNLFINLSPVANQTRLIINAKSGADIVSSVDFNPITNAGVKSRSTIRTSIIASTLSSIAAADTNAFERFNFQSRVRERINAVSQFNVIETHNIILRVAVNARSRGYFDPLLKPLNDLSLEIGPTKAASNANSRIAIRSTLTEILVADSSLAEKINFQTVFRERINAKSGASVVTFNTTNILTNPLFNNEVEGWYPVGTEGYLYGGIDDRLRVAYVQGVNDYSNEQYGPLGLYQTFKNFGTSKRYTITARVRNVGPVDSSRYMYVGIRFDDGTVINSEQKLVSTSDGYVVLTAEGNYSTNIINGATAYVITSTPFDNSSVDQTAIDSVILSVSDTINTIPLSLKASVSSTGYFDPLLKTLDTLTVEIGTARARSNATDRFRITGTIGERAIATSSLAEKINFRTVFRERVNARSFALDAMNHNLAAIARANVKSYALVDPRFAETNILVIEPLIAIAKSDLRSTIRLIGGLVIPDIPQYVYGNLLQNASFELENTHWQGIFNAVSTNTLDAQSGSQSLLVNNNLQTYDGEEFGPIGIQQSFLAAKGGKYSISAYVKNVSGKNPREMFAQVKWPNGQISKSSSVQVGNLDGWVNIQFEGVSELPGYATLSIITSTPFDSEVGDVAGIDNVSVELIGTFSFTNVLGLAARANGMERFAVSSRISPIVASAKTDNRINALFPIPLRLVINARSRAYVDPLINSIGIFTPINLTAGKNSNADIKVSSIFNPILDLTSDTNARDRFVFQSRLIASAGTFANGLIRERQIQPLRLVINAQSNGYADPLISTFNPIRLIAVAKVFGQVETGIQLGLTVYEYINAGAKSNARERLINRYILTETVASDTNANSRIAMTLRISPIRAFATGSGYFDTSVGPVNSLSIRSNGIAKQNLKEYIIFESLPTPTINALSGARDRFNFRTIVIQSVNSNTNGMVTTRSIMPIGATRAIAQASGYFDPLTVSQSINLRISAGGKSGGFDRISLVQTFLPIAPVLPITENQLQNASIEAGSGAWYGVNNDVSVISNPVQEGSSSLLVSGLNTYDEFPQGPFGARQDFIAIQNRRYTFTAYVQNTSGDSPRNMYLTIRWSDNTVINGIATPVASIDGWVQLSLNTIAPINGQATAYILTSTPFNSINGDTAVIDNVSLLITDTEGFLPYLGISVKSNANSRVVVRSPLLLQISTVTNSTIRTSSVMPLGANRAQARTIADIIASRDIRFRLTANAKSGGRFPVSIYLVGVALSGARDRFVVNHRLREQVTSTSDGFIPEILTGRDLQLTPQIINAKAGAKENLSLLMQLVADQPEQFEDVNLVRDADFNLGSLYWSGVTNGVEFTSEDSYDGGRSLLLRYQDFSDPDSLLPIAATQDFVALAGRDYTFSAWVKNIVGGPRTMQLKIVYSTGISEGPLVTVAPEDGWVQLSMTATSKNSGRATMYIIGSYAYKFFSTDATLVDSVSLVVANAPAKTINARVKSNGIERFVVRRPLVLTAGGNSNSSDRFVASYRISPVRALSTTNADLISTQFITLEPLRGIARVSGEPGISIPATIKPPTPGSGDETLSLIAKPNLVIRLRHNIILDGTSAGSNTNAFNISIRQISRISPIQAFATSDAYLSLDDIQNTTLRPIAAIANSRLDMQSSVTFDLQALNAVAQVGSKQGFGISTELVPADRINLFENPSFENGTKYWTGLSSFMYTTPEYSVDGGNSVLVFDNDWGTSGVSQEFNAYAGGNYSFSAYVRNISGLSPRTMYLQITWADGTNSISEQISVAQEYGWVRLGLVTQAGRGRTGVATARIVVSDGLLETNVVSAIDAATLTVDSFIPDYFETVPTTGTRLEATSGGQINPRVINRLTLSANIQSNAGFYQDARSIINNPMFELGSRFWTGLNNDVNITTDYVYEGTQAALVSRLDTFDDFPIGPLGISQDTYVYAGRTYTFAGYVKNIAGAEPRAMYAQIRWTNGSAIGEVKYVSINDEWTRVEVTATPTITGWASVQIITTSPFDGLISSDISAVDSVSITETNNRMQVIRISPISGGMKSTGYVDPEISTIATFSPSSNAIANGGGNIRVRLVSDISGNTAASNTNANLRIASSMRISPIRAQAQSVGQGFFDTFNAGLIIPQFSRGYAKVGGDAIVSVEFLPLSNAAVEINATSNLSVEYAISGDALIKSYAGGFREISSDPGIIGLLIPEVQLDLQMKSFGRIFTAAGGNVGDFIGWGQPL
jgi:hypothetical protein